MKRLFALLLLAGQASAAEVELGAGVAMADTLRLDSAVTSGTAEYTLLLDERRWDFSFGFIGQQDSREVGSFGYVSLQRVMRFGELIPLDLFLGIGLMARTHAHNIDSLLPSPVNFSVSAGWDIGRFRVEFRHASNGGFEDPNRGENWLLAGWTFNGASP